MSLKRPRQVGREADRHTDGKCTNRQEDGQTEFLFEMETHEIVLHMNYSKHNQ